MSKIVPFVVMQRQAQFALVASSTIVNIKKILIITVNEMQNFYDNMGESKF